jgi:hypothetical protein
MEPYARKDASFALCGLNCRLCPRFHTDGSSRCPGCGGADFSSKHPTCPVITCSKKHDFVEYCFECSEYPCKRYSTTSKVDSFMSYRNVIQNFSKAKKDIRQYLQDLKQKYGILLELISNYNDGRSKGFYCLVVDLLPLSELTTILKEIKAYWKTEDIDLKKKGKKTREIFELHAKKLKIELSLRN